MMETVFYNYDTLESTNDTAFTLAKPDKIVIVRADEQTKGRGRVGRSFVSQRGGLYLSIAAKIFEVPTCVTQLAGVCVMGTIGKICGVVTEIKWPNDILYDGKKLCGILCELHQKNDENYLIIGIGINVNNDLPDELPDATSLKTILGRTADIRGIFDDISYDISQLLWGKLNEKLMMAQYKAVCVNIGKTVKANYFGKIVSGVCVDISKNGALVLDTSEGIVEINAGEAVIK